MQKHLDNSIFLPSADEVRQAIMLYIKHAYGGKPSDSASKLIPPDNFILEKWLMSDITERDPADAPLENVRSFALRIGNSIYPHMKIRLSHPPREKVFLFSVDSHDVFLHAELGSKEHEMLEELKTHNSSVVTAVVEAWENAGLPTERGYLRGKINKARSKREKGT